MVVAQSVQFPYDHIPPSGLIPNQDRLGQHHTISVLLYQHSNPLFYELFETLQEKLESVNISNAKLLYINRALENASLNERQKRKIVEAISKAETVEQAKIVYETLNESVPSSHQSDRKFDNLNEAVSRRSSLLVSARSEQKEMAANPMYDRLQKLAGIKH